MKLPRLIRSAFVIARRDFAATVMSKAFLLFLLGPLFPVIVGIGFGGIGASIDRNVERPVIAVIASPADYRAIDAARLEMEPLLEGGPAVVLSQIAPTADLAAQRRALLAQANPPVLGKRAGVEQHAHHR